MRVIGAGIVPSCAQRLPSAELADGRHNRRTSGKRLASNADPAIFVPKHGGSIEMKVMPIHRQVVRELVSVSIALALVAIPFSITLKGWSPEISLQSAFAKDGNGKGGGNGNGNGKGGAAGKGEGGGKGNGGGGGGGNGKSGGGSKSGGIRFSLVGTIARKECRLCRRQSRQSAYRRPAPGQREQYRRAASQRNAGSDQGRPLPHDGRKRAHDYRTTGDQGRCGEAARHGGLNIVVLASNVLHRALVASRKATAASVLFDA